MWIAWKHSEFGPGAASIKCEIDTLGMVCTGIAVRFRDPVSAESFAGIAKAAVPSLKTLRLIETEDSDYRYRYILPKGTAFPRILSAMGEDIDYANFKSAVHHWMMHKGDAQIGASFYSMLTEVWRAGYDFQTAVRGILHKRSLAGKARTNTKKVARRS